MAAVATGKRLTLSGWERCCLIGVYFNDKASSRETLIAEAALRRKGLLTPERALTPRGKQIAEKLIDKMDRRLFQPWNGSGTTS